MKHRHLAALMLGLHALAWAPIPFWASVNMRMVYVLKSLHLEWVWLLWWLIIGIALIFGSLFPCRACRFYGLWLSAMGYFGFLSMYVRDWQYSPSTMTMLVMGMSALIILISDVRGKRRDVATD